MTVQLISVFTGFILSLQLVSAKGDAPMSFTSFKEKVRLRIDSDHIYLMTLKKGNDVWKPESIQKFTNTTFKKIDWNEFLATQNSGTGWTVNFILPNAPLYYLTPIGKKKLMKLLVENGIKLRGPSP